MNEESTQGNAATGNPETPAPETQTPVVNAEAQGGAAATENAGAEAAGAEGQQNPNEKILGKFKTVDDALKAYVELEKAYHAKAPSEYVIDTIEDESFKIQREDPMFKEFVAAAKKANLSQAQAEAVLGVYKKEVLLKTLNAQDEIKKLGADGEQQVNTVRNWLSNNLSKQSFDALAPFITSSQAVRALQELKGKLRQRVPGQPPGGHVEGGNTQEMRDSWMRNNWEKLKSGDPATKKEFDEIFKD